MTLRPLLPFSLLFAAAPAAAEDDAHVWSALVAQGPIGKDGLLFFFDGWARIGGEPGRFRQYIYRPAIGAKVSKTQSVFTGYALVRTGDAGDLVTEHRLWQQLGWQLVHRPGLKLASRSRIEQRFIGGSDDLALRFRQQIRADLPAGKLAVVLWTEPFINLNGPGRMRAGIDRWRTFAGVNVPVTKTLSLEPGYLNQYVRRRGDDLVNHVAAMHVVARW